MVAEILVPHRQSLQQLLLLRRKPVDARGEHGLHRHWIDEQTQELLNLLADSVGDREVPAVGELPS